MKKLMLLLAFSLITSFSFSQKLKTNEIDEFTGKVRKEASWETLCLNSQDYVHVRTYNYNGHITLDLKHMPSNVKIPQYAVEKGAKLMIILEDGTIVTLYNAQHIYSKNGGGSVGAAGSGLPGIDPSYPVEGDELELLKSQPIKKMRLITTIGHIEFELKKGKKEMIKNMLELVTEE